MKEAVQMKDSQAPVTLRSIPKATVDSNSLWVYYNVELQIRHRIIGGWPKHPDTERALLMARGLEDLIEEATELSTLSEEDRQKLATEAVQKSWVGFKVNATGHLVLESRCIKACLKESANIMKDLIGVKNLRARLAERVFVDQPYVSLGVTSPSGTESRPIHVMTMRGPRTSLKIYDYVEQPIIQFRLKVLKDDIITPDILRTLLEHGSENGLGADRSQENGKFDVIKFEAC